MDWKILIVVIAVLLGFFTVRKCSEGETPDYDRVMAKQRAERQTQFREQQNQEEEQEKRKLQEEARKVVGERPAEKTATLETSEYKMVLTTRGGTLKNFTLKNPQYLEPPRDWDSGLRNEDAKEYTPVDIVTTNSRDYDRYNPLRFEVYEGIDALLPDADYELVEATKTKAVFRHTHPGLPVVIHKKFEIADESQPFQAWLTIRVTNTGDPKLTFRAGVSQYGYQHQSEAKGSMFSKQPNLMQGICLYEETTYREPWNEIEESFIGVGNISFTGVETNYFIGAMVPAGDTPSTCGISTILANKYQSADSQPWGIVKASLNFGQVELKKGESKVFRVKNYLGPKRYRVLQSAGHGMEQSVDFGWLAPICQGLLWMLFAFQSMVSNWGVAIILLTVVVKVVLMPLTHRSFQSAERMKALKPEVDKINERFKDDAQKKQQEIMALYKQNGVNPLGGCLPTLLQMPIWFALFSTLRASPELYRAPFFGWINDLSNPDPYFVTPIVMGAMMFVQQRFTPMTGDSAQAKMMMYFMPIMFTAMMLFLPSGLTLYILVNTVLSIGHQIIIHRKHSKNA